MAVTSLTNSLDLIEQAVTLWSRPGEHWPQGPVGEKASTPITLSDYTSLLWELEDALLGSAPPIHSALRRLHYSNHVRSSQNHRRGIRLDSLIKCDESKYPLAWTVEPPVLSQTTLDSLFSAASLIPPVAAPRNIPVDLGALFTMTDALFSGGSNLAVSGELITEISLEGAVGWAGDLAIWFMTWEKRRQEAAKAGQEWNLEQRRQQLNYAQQESAPIELMLGNIDGQVLAAYLNEAVAGNYDFDSAPSIAETLEIYYAESPPVDSTQPHISRRFELFVPSSEPAIPHLTLGELVMVSSDAAEAVAFYITDLAALFIFLGQRDKHFGMAVLADRSQTLRSMEEIRNEINSQAETIQSIAATFIELIQGGLRNGQLPPTWPGRS